MLMKSAEYAKRQGVSPQAVRKAIREGRLRASVKQDERGSYLIDADLADQEWSRNTNLSKRTTAEAINAGKAAAAGASILGSSSEPNYSRARAFGEGFKAKLLELEYREKSGQLVRVDEVKHASYKAVRLFRDAVQQIPVRIVNELAAIVGDIPADRRHEMMLVMQREIDRTLEQIANFDGLS